MIDQILFEDDSAFGVEYQEVAGDPPPFPFAIEQVYTNEHLTQGAYDEFAIDSKYSSDTGLRVFPKAGSSNDATLRNAVVQLHRGMTVKTVIWTVQRQNAKPKLPRLLTKDPNEILEVSEITFANKYQLPPPMGILYRVSGIYRYKLIVPKGPQSRYPIGTTPAEISPSAANSYGPEDFTDTILDAAFAAPNVNVNLNLPNNIGPQ